MAKLPLKDGYGFERKNGIGRKLNTFLMITKLRLQNWKSFEDSTLYIDSLSILIGTNASGKSNVLDAFAFLRAIGEGKRLVDAIQAVRGGEEWIVRRGEKGFCISLQIEEEQTYLVDLRVQKNGDTFQYGSCDIHVKGEEKLKEAMPRQFGGTSYEMTWNVYGQAEASLDLLPLIYRNFRNVFILDPMPARMRDYCRVSKELKSDGSNVAGVLCALGKSRQHKVEALLSNYVRPLPERDINKVISVPIGLTKSDAMLYCYEDWNPENPVDARGMSDGTLRFIAIVVALLTAEPHSLLLIEEVDNGLHPSRAKELVDMLKQLSSERQVDVLCTTHNPVLLDELGNRMIPFVSYVTRDEKGNSRVNLLEDKQNLAKLMASGSIGSMMIKDKI